MGYSARGGSGYRGHNRNRSSHVVGKKSKNPNSLNARFLRGEISVDEYTRLHIAEREANKKPVAATIVPSVIPSFESYQEGLDYVDERSSAYPSKAHFYSSEEYKTLYPVLNRLRGVSVSKLAKEGQEGLRSVGLREGDVVEYVAFNPWGMSFVRKGKIKLDSDGVPMVKLELNEVDQKKQVRWHKGFVKINS